MDEAAIRALLDKGRYAEALGAAASLPLFERALAIREKALGLDHPDVATSAGNLANVLKDVGDFPRARALFERALAIREKTLGPDHPDVAKTLTHIASLWFPWAEPTRSMRS